MVNDTDTRPLRFAIIGAGMAGILSAVQLRAHGFNDFVIFEKADRLGGTWRENTYPGVACDVPSHLYSYSFAPNPDWTHRFSPGAEIQGYLEDVAVDFDVVRSIRFGEEVQECTFGDGQWLLTTDSGNREVADVIIAATGVLHHPRYPNIDGLDTFGGVTMHTARWSNTTPLDGRRVGIIGTGSSAIQTVPRIVNRVEHLSLFQRTAQWILPQENPAYTDEEKVDFRSDPKSLRGLREEISEFFANGFSNAVVDADSPQMAMIEAACQANLEETVIDPDLRERLRPDYRAGCKRLVVSSDFYEGIQQLNAELVTEPISTIEPRGVRTSVGQLHEVEVLILATGFDVQQFMRPMEVIGAHGARLSDLWAARPYAYLSIAIPGIPNLFMLNGPNGPVGNFSLIEVAELQMAYVLELVELLKSRQCRTISATTKATDRFEKERVAAAAGTVWATGCRSWYLDDRGIPMAWPWTFQRFRNAMAEPDLADFHLVS